MARPIFRIIDPGLGLAVQDAGRGGWRKYGLPPSGPIDTHSASAANKLLENVPGAPLLEILLHGAIVEVLGNAWVAVAGAQGPSIPSGRTVKLGKGDRITFKPSPTGVWTYLAVEGGLDVPLAFGSASYYSRGQVGLKLSPGTILAQGFSTFRLPAGVSARTLPPSERRNFSNPPPIRVWPGPQLSLFSPADQKRFFTTPWEVTSQCDRAGYRLQGQSLRPSPAEIISEPVLVGSIQVPENGQPLVTMCDGPTVGGYPKIGIVDPADLPYIAQSRAGQKISFHLV